MDMSSSPAHTTASWRVGNVPYLNVQPLIWAFQCGLVAPQDGNGIPLRFEGVDPRRLAQRLRAGEFDVAIVPVFEYFQHPVYTILPAGAIATPRHVGSVQVFANDPIEALEGIYLDTASLTSINLLRILAAENRWQVRFEEPRDSAALTPTSPRTAGRIQQNSTFSIGTLPARWGCLLIGDPALKAVGQFRFAYDLGALWYELTGLPFVFAAWLVHPSAKNAKLREPFTKARMVGCAHLETIAKQWAPRLGITAEFTLRYLKENLSYELNEAEIAGMREFARLSERHGLCASVPEFRYHEL
jgi:chorismate dehydratase